MGAPPGEDFVRTHFLEDPLFGGPSSVTPFQPLSLPLSLPLFLPLWCRYFFDLYFLSNSSVFTLVSVQAFALEEELLALGDVPQPPPSAAGLDAETFAAGFAAVVAASVGVWFGMRYFRQTQKTGRRVEIRAFGVSTTR